MASLSTWLRYFGHKLEYSITLGLKIDKSNKLSTQQLFDVVWRNLLHGKLTYLHWDKGQEMAPTLGIQGNTLLVRKLPVADSVHVHVGDAVVLKDPNESDKFLVRRLAAIEGYEMVSSDEEEEPFVLNKNQCWVVAENKELKPKEAYDSRIFGPISTASIVGRAVYCLRNAVDHGPVNNSHYAMQEDSSVLAVELDVDEMAKNHKA